MSEWCGDCEYPSVFREETRKAKKEHWCDACGEAIPVGLKYSNTFGVWDGRASTIKRCARCEAIFQHLAVLMHNTSEEAPALRLDCGHEYVERWGVEPPPAIAALAFWLPGDPAP